MWLQGWHSNEGHCRLPSLIACDIRNARVGNKWMCRCGNWFRISATDRDSREELTAVKWEAL